ncbi:MAG: hypothetical protein ACHQFW_11500 [Chitinophagales bacterium]
MQKNLFNQPVLLLKLVASVMYITMGIIILAVPGLINGLGQTFSYALSAVLIIYGIFRLIRVLGEFKENND